MAISKAELVEAIKKDQGDLSLRAYAAHLGVSAAYLSDFYRGRRDAGKTLLSLFGYRRTRTVTDLYIKTRKEKA